ITFESPSVTMTIFSPAATHFLVHASPAALAPLAPHFASVIHPLTVVLFPMSSNAIADRANTKQNARQITRTFLMAGFSPFEFQIAVPPRKNPQRFEDPGCPLGSSNLRSVVKMRHPKYTTSNRGGCQCAGIIHAQRLSREENCSPIFS